VSTTTWDAVHDSREAFRCLLSAQCWPGSMVPDLPRAGLNPALALDVAAGILLSLADPGVALGEDGSPGAGELVALVCSMTGAQRAPLGEADLVLASGSGPATVADRLRRGTRAAPEDGATVIYHRPEPDGTGAGTRTGTACTLEGPGLPRRTEAILPLPGAELEALRRAGARPPLGVDALIVVAGSVLALPRSTTVSWLGRQMREES
jgi:alpha-D-ribose 1-methylphosphonate 5-triphosphate synthase subunit PhnH